MSKYGHRACCTKLRTQLCCNQREKESFFFFFVKACGEGKSLGLSEVSQMFGLKVDASVLPKACFKL